MQLCDREADSSAKSTCQICWLAWQLKHIITTQNDGMIPKHRHMYEKMDDTSTQSTSRRKAVNRLYFGVIALKKRDTVEVKLMKSGRSALRKIGFPNCDYDTHCCLWLLWFDSDINTQCTGSFWWINMDLDKRREDSSSAEKQPKKKHTQKQSDLYMKCKDWRLA